MGLSVCGSKWGQWEVSFINTNSEEIQVDEKQLSDAQGWLTPAEVSPGLPTEADDGNSDARADGAAGTVFPEQPGSGSDLLEKVGARSEAAAQENAGDSQAGRGSSGCSRRCAIPVNH